MDMKSLYLLVPMAPLVGAAIAGLFCRVIPRWVAHTVTIAGVAIATGIRPRYAQPNQGSIDRAK